MQDDAEFTAYVQARWARLVRSAVLLGCTSAEAEDVVQNTLLKCLHHWKRVQAAVDREAYVHRILINTFNSSRRRRWTGERPVAELPDVLVSDPTEAVDLTDAIVRSLDRLTADQRAVVILRFYARLSEQQTAAALDVAQGTVKSRLSRALAVLADDPSLTDLRGAR